MAESVIPGLEDLSGSNPTHCPLCHAPVDGKDGLQLHYLTSCGSYDRLSSEQPRSKPRPNQGREPPSISAPGTAVGDRSFTPPTSKVQFLWQPLTEITYPEILLLASFEPGSVPLKLDSDGSHYASNYISIPTGTYEGQLVIGDNFIYPVKKFSIIRPDATIVLTFDVEQQKQFDSDTVLGSTSVYGSGEMQQNPSYTSPRYPEPPSSTGGLFNTSFDTFRSGTGFSSPSNQPTLAAALTSSSPSVTQQHTTSGQDITAGSKYGQPLSHTLSYTRPSTTVKNALTTSTTKTTRTAVSGSTRPTIAANLSPSTVSSVGPYTSTQSSLSLKPRTTPIISKTTNKRNVPSTATLTSGSHEQSPMTLNETQPPPGDVSMVQLLGIVTKERDSLQASQTRLNAQWESQVKRLENELVSCKSGKALAQQQSNALTGQLREAQEQLRQQEQELATLRRQKDETPSASGDTQRELSEVKDRNTALEQQLEEYAGTITDQSKYIQSSVVKEQVAGSISNKEVALLSQFVKKQQLEYSETLATTQGQIQDTGSSYEDLNRRLMTEVENYRQQLETLVTDNRTKEAEICQLREALTSKAHGAQELELATMRQKVEAYQSEFAQMAPMKDEAERLTQQNAAQNAEISQLRADNEDITKQLQTVLDSSAGVDPSLAQKAKDYDRLLTMLHELQQKRIELENELQPLREERAATLTENAVLREGSDPQNYAKLKQDYQTLQEEHQQMEAILNQQSALLNAHESSSREMQTRLLKNSNPEMLQSIKNKMDRYKSERDSAKKKIEELELQNAAAQTEYQTISQKFQEATAQSDRVIAEFEALLSTRDTDLKQLRHAEEKVSRYREERNQEKRKCRDLEKQLANWRDLVVKSNGDLPDYEQPGEYTSSHQHSEVPGSPLSDRPYPTDFQQYQREAETSPLHELEAGMSAMSMEPSKANRKRAPAVGARQRVVSETSSFEMVDVKTKEGVRVANIGKPRGGFNARKKPIVIVKRGDEYEQGTLMFVGEIDGKEMAGVVLDCKISKLSSSGSHHDGTYKDGRRYFTANPGYGLYLPVAKVFLEMGTAYV